MRLEVLKEGLPTGWVANDCLEHVKVMPWTDHGIDYFLRNKISNSKSMKDCSKKECLQCLLVRKIKITSKNQRSQL